VNERIGILGGAFDPPHFGHLILAEQALDQLKLDHVLFVPSFQPPQNHKSITTPFDQRCEMLDLALEPSDKFKLSRVEENLEPPTYTVRMLEAINSQQPEASLFFLMGADSLEQLNTWFRPEELQKRAEIVVARRPGSSPGQKAAITWLDMPLIEISASKLRARVRSGRSIRFLVPDIVIDYITRCGLYLD